MMVRFATALGAAALLMAVTAPAASADLLPNLPPLLPTPLTTTVNQTVRAVTQPVAPVVQKVPVVNQIVPSGSTPAPSAPAPTGGDPAAQPAPSSAQGQRQPAFAPPPAETQSLPPEPARVAFETQQADLQGAAPAFDQQFTGLSPADGGSGQFGWPIAFRGRPHITQGFGCTDVAGEPYSATCSTHRFHTGIDLGVPTGTPILASAPGIAHVFRSTQGYGNHVLIAHGGGWFTLYGHMTDFAIQDGQTVARGDQIGWSGSTGFSTGPHLHFEIRHDQDYEDPCAWLTC
jgi:murein DD-endopeptidase MepM/ murein hydrolase activator NlpD